MTARHPGSASWVTALVGAIACFVLAVALGASSPQAAQAADKDCDDFSNQSQAQSFFESHNPGSDPHYLDGDNDGKACETLPCPCGSGGGGGGGHDGGGGGRPKPDPTDHARVNRVIDGDTIAVSTGGRNQDVRLVGIDTPEVYGGEECGGEEASRSLRNKLDRGDGVKLVRDRSQDNKDRYGRLLRYVEDGGRDVGRRQIARGWAEVYVFESRFNRVGKYRRSQRRAKGNDAGVWGMCNGHF